MLLKRIYKNNNISLPKYTAIESIFVLFSSFFTHKKETTPRLWPSFFFVENSLKIPPNTKLHAA